MLLQMVALFTAVVIGGLGIVWLIYLAFARPLRIIEQSQLAKKDKGVLTIAVLAAFSLGTAAVLLAMMNCFLAFSKVLPN